MKKMFLMLAFTGIVGASMATTVVFATNGTTVTLGDEKKGDDKKKSSDNNKKECSHSGKSCCKRKEGVKGEAKADAKPVDQSKAAAPAPASK